MKAAGSQQARPCRELLSRLFAPRPRFSCRRRKAWNTSRARPTDLRAKLQLARRHFHCSTPPACRRAVGARRRRRKSFRRASCWRRIQNRGSLLIARRASNKIRFGSVLQPDTNFLLCHTETQKRFADNNLIAILQRLAVARRQSMPAVNKSPVR